jgi:hypothetical protein
VDAAGLGILGDPYCRILATLDRPGLNRSNDRRADFNAIGNPGAAGTAHFTGGTRLDLPAAAPDFPSFLYVDYFSADGRVFHLLPGDKPGDNRLAPNERFRIGGPAGRGREARIGPPYGLDVVVAIASSQPLPLHGRPIGEPASAYLTSLDTAIAGARRDDPALRLEYAYFLIYTAPEGTTARQVAADALRELMPQATTRRRP